MTTLTTAQIVSLFNDFANAEKAGFCNWLLDEGFDQVSERSEIIMGYVLSGLEEEWFNIGYTYESIEDLWLEFANLCKGSWQMGDTEYEIEQSMEYVDRPEFCWLACPIEKPEF